MNESRLLSFKERKELGCHLKWCGYYMSVRLARSLPRLLLLCMLFQSISFLYIALQQNGWSSPMWSLQKGKGLYCSWNNLRCTGRFSRHMSVLDMCTMISGSDFSKCQGIWREQGTLPKENCSSKHNWSFYDLLPCFFAYHFLLNA